MITIGRGVLAFVIAAAAAAAVASFSLPTFWDASPAPRHPTKTMAAVVYRTHGNTSVLEYQTAFPRPMLVLPQQEEKKNQNKKKNKRYYLIHVKASALNPVDFKLRRNTRIPPLIVPLPKIPGGDIAGVVVQVPNKHEGNGNKKNHVSGDENKNHNKFQVGDRVAALIPYMGTPWGGLADYVVVEEQFMARLGNNTEFVQAAAVPLASLTVLQNLRNLQHDNLKDKRILIHAGAGGVGSFAIQYAKHVLGASQVATTASAPKAALLHSLGADRVIDYRTERFEDSSMPDDEAYDIILDPMSWLYEARSFQTKSNVLKPTGHYLNIPSSDWGFGPNGVERANGFTTLKNILFSKFWNLVRPDSVPKYSWVAVQPNGNDLQHVLDLLEKGTIRPVIDRRFPLSEAAAAYAYLEAGHATGKVVLYHDSRYGNEK